MTAHADRGARPDPIAGGIALLGGAVAVISVASLAAFFAVGRPFGAISDWTTGVFGLLAGCLALAMRPRDGIGPEPPGIVAIGSAVVGSAVVVVGSALVISDTTGFLLAGLVESLGFALIGVWLIVLNRSMTGVPRWPRGLTRLGTLAGLVLAIGFLLVPAVAMGLDDASTAPTWVWIGFLGWLGVFFLFPAWCIWLGMGARRGPTGGGLEP